MVYLIHLNTKFKHAAHYVGFVNRALKKRLEQHKNGSGARFMQVLKENAVTWTLARTWTEGDRTFERKLKNTKNVKRYCPLCNGGKTEIYSPKNKAL